MMSMSKGFVRFDGVVAHVADTLKSPDPIPIGRIYVIRDLYGKVRLAVPEESANDDGARKWLEAKAETLRERLGARSYPLDEAVLYLDPSLIAELRRDGRELVPGAVWVDRLLTGAGWWTMDGEADSSIYTLYSVKGGVGRSTTAAVLAWHLARRGEEVLVVDLDLESPGISSAMLDPSLQPDYGVVDWFVEDLVGQGGAVAEDMVAQPMWTQDLAGDVCIVPAHGAESGEYLAKLGRVYMDTSERWTKRLQRLLRELREAVNPSIVLLESRSGLHDIAAATVSDLNAHVLLFAVDSETNWQDYRILFKHWRELGLARDIRRRLSIVSGLTPDINATSYVARFRERSWALFQDHLYDSASTDEPYEFTFEVLEDGAPHDPMPIHWTRALAAGASLRDIEDTTVHQAYGNFLGRFDQLLRMNRGGE